MMSAHLISHLIRIHHAGMNEVAKVLRRRCPATLARDLVVDVTARRGGVECAAKDEIGDALPRRPSDCLRAQDAGGPDRRVRLLQWQLPRIDDAQVIVLALPSEGPGTVQAFLISANASSNRSRL